MLGPLIAKRSHINIKGSHDRHWKSFLECAKDKTNNCKDRQGRGAVRKMITESPVLKRSQDVGFIYVGQKP